jgi:hypothetical protein
MDIRMSIGRANRITNPRLLAAMRDPRVDAIEAAFRACDAAGHRREQLINGRYAWPRHYVAILDELKLHRVPAEQIMAIGDAMRDAAYQAADALPTESVGEVFALEAVAEGEANRDTAHLIDAPHCPSRRRAAVRSLTYHGAMLERAKRVLLR